GFYSLRQSSIAGSVISSSQALLFHLSAEFLPQLIHVLRSLADLFDKFLIQLRQNFVFNTLNRNLKDHWLSSQFFSAIILGEGDVDFFLIADMAANQLFFKAGDKATRA